MKKEMQAVLKRGKRSCCAIVSRLGGLRTSGPRLWVCLCSITSLLLLRASLQSLGLVRTVENFEEESLGLVGTVENFEEEEQYALNSEAVKYVFVVHVSKQEKYAAIRATWFSVTSPLIGLFTFGAKEKVVFPGPPIHPHLYYVHATTISNDAGRTFAALAKALVLYPNAQYFIKADDDAYLYTKNILSYLEKTSLGYAGASCGHDAVANGLKGVLNADNLDAKEFFKGYDFLCGAGYILSRNLAAQVVEHQRAHHAYEDMAIAVRLRDKYQENFLSLITILPGICHRKYFELEVCPPASVPMLYHHLEAYEILEMHDDINLYRAVNSVKRSKLFPTVLHYLEQEEPSCRKVNPSWSHRVWSTMEAANLRPILCKDPPCPLPDSYNTRVKILEYKILANFGGVFIPKGYRCVQGLDRFNFQETGGSDVVPFFEGFHFFAEEDLNAQRNSSCLATVSALYPFSASAITFLKEFVKSNSTCPRDSFLKYSSLISFVSSSSSQEFFSPQGY